MTNYALEIKSRVTMPEVIKKYSTVTPRKHRIPCPIHNGKHYNLWFDNVKFICYQCGKKGSVIDFVMYMEQCNCEDACQKLDAMFHLGLYKHHSFKERRQMEREARARKKATEEHRRREEYSEEQYKILCSYSQWLYLQEATEPVKFDIDYLDRIFQRNDIITWDATARINALLEKHSNRGEYDKYARNRGLDG